LEISELARVRSYLVIGLLSCGFWVDEDSHLIIDHLLVEVVDFVIVIYVLSHALVDLRVAVAQLFQLGQREAVYLSQRFVDAAYLDILWRWCLFGFYFSALFVLQQTQAMVAESNSLINRAGAINGAGVLEDGHREVLTANPLRLFQEGAGAHARACVDNDELADHVLGLLGERIGWVLEDSPLYPHVELIFA
jgi:hypothetical protein